MEDLEHIVETDEKQRYSFNDDKTLIRANQGHSIPIDLELEAVEPPETLYHGTIGQFLGSIKKEGLQRRSRQFVHLSKDVETALAVRTPDEESPLCSRLPPAGCSRTGMNSFCLKTASG